ncbi:hypothetical protein [uncultured Tateyamaria sp.]|uniref:hypothetical protein n=1 Tax=Tateyamaria sp. 1078 TaxID=3417464 RepID=UPI002634A0F5|nr:hypothetical protein [uncultured Tateyamaria sp.]
MPSSFRFFPNLQLGAVAGAQVEEDGRLRAEYGVQITSPDGDEGSAVPVSARFRGPGDVIGINDTEIARFEPVAGITDFEPDYFPFVEFRSPDLPWRFSLGNGWQSDTSQPIENIAPWIVLIALTDDEFERLGRGTAPCNKVLVYNPATSLPDPEGRWADAHVQMNSAASETAAAAALRSNPDSGFSRLICPRRLKPLTRYSLFIVPAYESGRKAGLGLDPLQQPSDPTDPAWSVAADSPPVTLPYYASSSFRTDEGLNLEALLEQLRSLDDREADALAAGDTFRIDVPGYFQTVFPATSPAAKQTALKPTGAEVGENPATDRLKAATAFALNQVIAGETQKSESPEAATGGTLEPAEAAVKEAEDYPLVGLPPYGFRYLKRPEITPAADRWAEEINLDPRFRLAAQLGAACVRDNQEELMASAWDQYAEMVEANRALQRLQTAEALVERTVSRRFDAVAADVAVSLSEPFFPYARMGEESQTDALPGFEIGQSVGAYLEARGAPQSYTSRDLRRIGARVQTRTPETGRALRAPQIPGDQTPSAAGTRRPGSALDVAELRLQKRNRRLAIDRLGAAGLLRNAAEVRPVARKTTKIGVKPFASEPLKQILSDRLRALPRLKADFRITGRSEREVRAGGAIFRDPRLPVPLVDYLLKREPGAFMAGLRDMPDDTIAFFEENRAFVEAVLLGANHEVNQELRWRGFPTDMRGTVLPRFWNRGAPRHDPAQDDIGAITHWAAPLGRQHSPINDNGNPSLVVLIKGAVVRKLDEPVLRIDISTKADTWEAGRVQRKFLPAFSGKLGTGLAYYGFDVSLDWLLHDSRLNRAFFVILEPPGRLRFGLDVGSRSTRQRAQRRSSLTNWDELSFSHLERDGAGYIQSGQELAKPQGATLDLWGSARSSASIARSYWQKPIAAVVPIKGVFDGR